MISVIIPAYNAHDTVAGCVESIVRSTRGDVEYEIVIVNDGSSDATDAVCRELRARYPQIKYFSEPNGGVSSARNYGMDHASGEYFCFVDADDSVSADYLDTLSRHAADADITFFGFERFDTAAGSSVVKTPQLQTSVGTRAACEAVMAQLLGGGGGVNYFGFTWSKVFRADIIRRHRLRFDTRLRIKEDEIFTLEYCRHINTAKVLDKALYRYNIYPGSLSHAPSGIRYDILSEDYWRLSGCFSAPELSQTLIGLSVSYGMGYARQMKRRHDRRRTMAYIESYILFPVKAGYGIRSSRWMRWVRLLPGNKLKAAAIYLLLR